MKVNNLICKRYALVENRHHIATLFYTLPTNTNIMKTIDLTHTITKNIREYPGDPKTRLEQVDNEYCTSSKITTGLHTGTHMDAPLHFIKNGSKIMDLNLDEFTGRAKVICSNIEDVNWKNSLEDILIINTGWSKYWNSHNYFVDYPYLTIEFAEILVDENVKGIAIDTCSVDKNDETKIHKKLLKNNIWIVENIANSNKLKRDYYDSYFIPLKIDAEASPVRAFVREI